MATKLMRQHPDSKQAQSRAHAVWFDQHRDTKFTNTRGERAFEYGRPWWSVIEKASGMPSGPIYPLGWEAPWLPPQHYVIDSIGKIPKQELGLTTVPKGTASDRFHIAYGRMVKDDSDATRAHYEFAVTVAHQKNLPMPKWGDTMDSRLIVIVGVQPRSPKIAEAALGGNKWLLGQLMPTLDPQTGTMRIEEDEQLARLLKMHHGELWTPEQAERAADAEYKAQAEVREMFEQMVAMKKEMERLRETAPPKSKGGRPKKITVPAED